MYSFGFTSPEAACTWAAAFASAHFTAFVNGWQGRVTVSRSPYDGHWRWSY